VSRSELQKELYGDTPPNSDALRTYIHILRSKLEKAGKPILQTVPRVGFRLSEE
ncbi:MAG: winged helix-turn-helix domain-containing protein, partial [Mailhella sp.]|nr:winged helix-turn-helix domain-containing protein [Mailhella sp.]